MKSHLEQLFRVMPYANRHILAALRDCPAAQSEGLPLMAHIVAAEHIGLMRLKQKGASLPAWPQLTLTECEKLAVDNAAGFSALLGSLSESDLGKSITYRDTDREKVTTAVREILLRVVVHGAYHRARIAEILGLAGHQAPDTDHITFSRSMEPLWA
jgi:uncharacterized damage-inducible protein DinB